MRIMPAGDSNIAAVNPTTPADVAHWYGFRYRLKALLEASGVPVDFVGSSSTGWVNMSDCECEYWPGLGISQIAARVTGGMLATYAPDVMILLIGTNDIRNPGTGILVSDEQAAVVVTAYRALVAQIIAARPTMWLVILNPGTPIGGSMPIFRAGVLQCYVDQQAAGKLVAYADAQDAASDGLHYSAAGHETIAARLAPVVAGLAGLNLPVPSLPVAAPAPVRVPTQPTGEWVAQCFLSPGTHSGASSAGLFGRSVALAPDRSRLFVGGVGGPQEYVADPAGYVGWSLVPGNIPWAEKGTQHNALALLPDDGALYVGTMSFDYQSPPSYYGLYIGGVKRAELSGGRYTGEPVEFCLDSETRLENDQFGYSVAISPDDKVMAIGSPGYGHRGIGGFLLGFGYGHVYIYDKVDGAWVLRPEYPEKTGTVWDPNTISARNPTEDDITEHDYYGSAVALIGDGSRLFVGETGEPWGSYVGNVYVYDWHPAEGEESGYWGLVQFISGLSVDSLGYAAKRFGHSLCCLADGSLFYVGAPRANNERGNNRGTVYGYELDGESGLYVQAHRIVSPTLTRSALALGVEYPNSFGSGVACDATGTMLVVGEGESGLTSADIDQPIPPNSYYLQGIVWIWQYELIVPVPDAELDPEYPPEDQYYQSEEGPVLLFPYRPLVPVVEALAWTTDAVEAFAGNERRRGARAIPRQSWDWRVLVQDRAWYALFRGLMTGPFWVPAWHEGWLTEAQIDPGAMTLTVPASVTDYGEWRGQLVLWSSPAWCELIGIASVAGDTITLSTAVTKTYPVGATVMPARLCRMGNLVQAQDARDFALLDLSWVLLDAAELEPFQLDAAELMGFLPVAPDGLLDRDLGSTQQETDYQTGVLGFDSRHADTRWACNATTYRTSRADAWALKLWLYSLQGRRGGFWLPTGKSDVLLSVAAASTDTVLTIERVNYYAQLFTQAATDRYLHFQRAGSVDPIVRQVTDAEPAVGDLETITLDEALGIAAQPGTFPYISWLYPVRLDGDRIELTWEAPDRLVVTMPVREVSEASHVE